jgi:hypothetical protein
VATGVLAVAAKKALERPKSVHDAAFQAMFAELDVDNYATQSRPQQKAQHLQRLAPLWHTILKNLSTFDAAKQKSLLVLYLAHVNSDSLQELGSRMRTDTLKKLQPDSEAYQELIRVLPGLLPRLTNKPVLHMSVAEWLMTLLKSDKDEHVATAAQKATAHAALRDAVAYSPGMLDSISNPRDLWRRQSPEDLADAARLRVKLKADLGIDDTRFADSPDLEAWLIAAPDERSPLLS